MRRRTIAPMLSPSRSSGTLKMRAAAVVARHVSCHREFRHFVGEQVVNVHRPLSGHRPARGPAAIDRPFLEVHGIGP